jgi:hypothetical protein
VAIGISLGLIPGLLPLTATLGLEAALLLGVSLTIVWMLLRARPALASARAAVAAPRTAPAAQPYHTTASASSGPGTLFFLLAASTVVEANWRPGGFPVCDIFFLASFGWCCLSVLRGRPLERLPMSLVIGVALFALGGVLSAIGSQTPSQSLYEVMRSIWVLLLWPWIAVMVLRDRRDLMLAMVLWGVSGTVDALVALGQVADSGALAGQIGGTRATGFSTTPNDLGAAAAVLFVPVLALAVRCRPRLRLLRLVQWAMVGLIGVALILSGSVSAAVGALVALLLWVVSPGVPRATRVAMVLGVAGAFAAGSIIGGSVPSPAHRIQEVFAAPGSSPDAGSATLHLDTIKFAWPRIRSDPIIGVGFNKVGLLVHNGLIAAWYGGGILSLVGLLLAFGAVLSLGWWAAVTAGSDADRSIAWALVCGVVALFLFQVNQPLFFQPSGFIANALLVAWASWIARTRRGPSQSVGSARSQRRARPA